MTNWEIFMHRVRRTWAGLDTPWELLLLLMDHATQRLTGKNPRRQAKSFARRMRSMMEREGDHWRIGDVRLPLLDEATELTFLAWVFEDIFHVYLHHGDRYDESSIDRCYTLLPEGPFGLRNERVDVRVEEGDVVLDAGSWIGDFAAYASAKGATAVYAFEPIDATYAYLTRTAELNANVIPVKKGLSDHEGRAAMSIDAASIGNAILTEGSGRSVELTTVDAFVKERGLQRVDFIKADIEGAERDMLRGAQETLSKFKPKLALCTYHLPDDPEVLAALIKEAEPSYEVVQKRKKLYASVPREGGRSSHEALLA